MKAVLFLVVVALGLGICLGKWWEHDRPGGVADLEDITDNLEADNQLLRDERDERRAASMAWHPSSTSAADAIAIQRGLRALHHRTGRRVGL